VKLLAPSPRLIELTAGGDVKLVCRGGVVVRAHALILSMASPVLKGSLEAQPSGKGGDFEIPCADDCPATWLKLLSFLYSVGAEEQRLTWSILEPVLRLADKCARALPRAFHALYLPFRCSAHLFPVSGLYFLHAQTLPPAAPQNPSGTRSVT